ncbi:hypothetical protein AOC05_08915 [Arthrobacter alpinus]|uniref:PASTA domain-containing protein n=2 Tax=Arthrobacter alpinus TaxID=656366 RepID=A0A0M4QWP6_9MICC|nr:hypothetical protein AOC05_08915 [Arthrobacter alpinus]
MQVVDITMISLPLPEVRIFAPSPAADPPTTPAAVVPDALSGPTLLWALVIVAVVVLIVSIFVLWARLGATKAAHASSDSMIRSWVAAILVVGLLLLTVLSFGLRDSTLRSALVGGITASVGVAIAFYFSAKSADAARQDVLKAAAGTALVPDLVGCTWEEANTKLGTTVFKLAAATPSHTSSESRRKELKEANQRPAGTVASAATAVGTGPNEAPTQRVVAQDPTPNSNALKGSNVTVYFD